jgi:CubicO group peptidase (beta-lactamase class C family)
MARQPTGRCFLQLASTCGAILVVLGHGAVYAQDPLKGFDDFANQALADWQVPGMAIAVVKDGKVVLARGYGLCKLGEKTPVDERTVFRIASCTKSFTAACLGILVDEGKLKWDDPVTKHLPGFQLYDPYVAREVTIRDLLCHRVGLESGHLLASRGDHDRTEILRRMQFLRPIRAFRSLPGYHNLCYVVAAEVVAKNSGKSWEEFVQGRILHPLGMKATLTSYWARAQLRSKNAATPHERIDGKVQPFEWQPKDNRAPSAGAGGMHSNVVDMAQWLKLQLGEGVCDGKRLLKAGTILEMHAAHCVKPVAGDSKSVLPYPKFFSAYGLGWWLRDYRGRKVIYHTGSSGAVVAMMPEEKLGIVVLTNLHNSGLAAMLMHDVFDLYLGIPRPWTTRDWLDAAVEAPEKAAQEASKKRETERVKNTKPSLPLRSHVGTYENDLYGKLEIKQTGNKLVLHFGPEMVADMSHWHYDMFHAGFRKPRNDSWLVRFVLSAKRTVEHLEVDLWDGGESLPPFKRARE